MRIRDKRFSGKVGRGGSAGVDLRQIVCVCQGLPCDDHDVCVGFGKFFYVDTVCRIFVTERDIIFNRKPVSDIRIAAVNAYVAVRQINVVRIDGAAVYLDIRQTGYKAGRGDIASVDGDPRAYTHIGF